MSAVIYREGTAEDFPIVAEMYAILDEYFRTLELRLPKPDNVGQVWVDSFRRTHGRFSNLHIAELDGEIVGFALSRLKQVPPYWGGVSVGVLSDLWVSETARKLGVGDRLTRNSVEWLRQQGAHSIEVQVLESNESAWKLYQKMGFKSELRQIRLLWDDYIEGDA